MTNEFQQQRTCKPNGSPINSEKPLRFELFEALEDCWKYFYQNNFVTKAYWKSTVITFLHVCIKIWLVFRVFVGDNITETCSNWKSEVNNIGQ